jgi:hypothetical protein
VTEDPTTARPGSIGLGAHIWLAWLAFATAVLTATKSDPDLWGHTRFGIDWWKTGTLPLTDQYSFTHDRPWINHEWLSEALMGGSYVLGGTPGLIALKLAVIAAALCALLRLLRPSTPVVAAGVLTAVVVCILPLTLTIRPQLWSLTGLVLLAALLAQNGRPGRRRMIAGAALFAAWANLHGGWITGAAVLCAYAVARAIRQRQDALRWITFMAACGSGTLLNPYGVGLWRFLAATVRTSRPDITEWAPLSPQSPLILLLPLLTVPVIAVVLHRRQDTRLPIEIWAVLFVLVAGAVRVSRVAPLVAPAAAAFLAPYLSRFFQGRGKLSVVGRPAAGLFWIPAIVATIATAPITARAFRCVELSDDWAPDLHAAAYLRGATGRLLTTFDWGEYAIWHFGPDLKVSVDGRRETVYSDSVIAWHRAFERGDADAQKLVAGLSPDYVWLRSSKIQAREWLLANGYRIDVDTGMSFVAARRSLPRLEPTEPMSRCFP